MKKAWILFLCFLLIMVFASCKAENENPSDQASTPTNNNTADDQKTIDHSNEEAEMVSETIQTAPNDFTSFKDGLTYFVSAYTTAKDPYAALIDGSPESENYLFDLLGYYMLDLNLVSLPLYDALNPLNDGTKINGSLMLTGYEGFKEKDGDLIRFGYEHMFSEEEANYEKGDIVKQLGYFDTKKNYLTFEDTVERNGKLIQRNFYEITSPKEGAFQLQNYSYDERTSLKNTNCTFLKFDKDALYYLESIKEPTTDFVYNSLEPNKDYSLDDLASGSTNTFRISIENNVPVFESTK